MLANPVSFMEINIYIRLSFNSGVEGEPVLLRIPVSSFTLFCGYLCTECECLVG